MTRKEAIDIIRDTYHTDEEMKALEILVPELSESEDERIRKAIIELLKEIEEDETYTGRQHIPNMIAYLEKQKEEEGYETIPVESTLEYKLGFNAGKESEKQKESLRISETCKENTDSFTDEDDRIRKWLYNYISNCPNNNFAFYGGVGKDAVLNYIEKQKEIPLMNGDADLYFDEWNQQKQNPTKRQCFEEGMRYVQRLQKEQMSAELSEEVLAKIKHDMWMTIKGEHIKALQEAEIEGFNKGLKVGKELQTVEWSDEDEKMVRFYEADYNNQIGDMSMKDVIDMRLQFKNWLVNRLKSLRLNKQD